MKTKQTLGILSGLVLAMAACQLQDTERDNPRDPSGANWNPPSVRVVTGSDTTFRDSAETRLHAHGIAGNRGVSRYRWLLDGVSSDSLTDSVWHPRSGLAEGTHQAKVWAVDSNGVTSLRADSLSFRVYDQPPVLTKVRDTSLLTKKTFSVIFSAADPDGTVAKYLFDTAGRWDSASTAPQIVLSSTSPAVRKVRWGVRDDLGKVVTDSFTVSFLADLPIVTPVSDTVLSATKTVAIALAAHPLDGSTSAIAMYRWSFDGGAAWDSSSSGNLSVANPAGGIRTVIWAARNAVGNLSANDVFVVKFVPAPSNLTVTVDSILTEWTGKTGSLAFSWSGSIAGFSEESVTWDLQVGSPGNLSQVYSGTSHSWTKIGVDSGVIYGYRLTGKNRLGDSLSIIGDIRTEFKNVPLSNDGIPWNRSVDFGKFTDGRDGSQYWAVDVGGLTWMAQNLRFRSRISTCHADDPDCSRYGALYTELDAKVSCPADWRLPTEVEWDSLVAHAGGDQSGIFLKSKGGWQATPDGKNGNGIDSIGLRSIPAGRIDSKLESSQVGLYSYFWALPDVSGLGTIGRVFGNGYSNAPKLINANGSYFSVRCVK